MHAGMPTPQIDKNEPARSRSPRRTSACEPCSRKPGDAPPTMATRGAPIGSALQPRDRIDTGDGERTRLRPPPTEVPQVARTAHWRSAMQVASTRRELRRHVRPVLTRRRRVAICAVSAVSALLLSGCAGGGASTSSHAVRGVSSAPGTAEGFASSSAAKPAVGTPQEQSDVSRTSASKPGTSVVGAGSKLTRSASLDLQVKNISTAAARVRGIAIGLQALVLSEQIGKSRPGGQGPMRDHEQSDGGLATRTV